MDAAGMVKKAAQWQLSVPVREKKNYTVQNIYDNKLSPNILTVVDVTLLGPIGGSDNNQSITYSKADKIKEELSFKDNRTEKWGTERVMQYLHNYSNLIAAVYTAARCFRVYNVKVEKDTNLRNMLFRLCGLSQAGVADFIDNYAVYYTRFNNILKNEVEGVPMPKLDVLDLYADYFLHFYVDDSSGVPSVAAMLPFMFTVDYDAHTTTGVASFNGGTATMGTYLTAISNLVHKCDIINLTSGSEVINIQDDMAAAIRKAYGVLFPEGSLQALIHPSAKPGILDDPRVKASLKNAQNMRKVGGSYVVTFDYFLPDLHVDANGHRDKFDWQVSGAVDHSEDFRNAFDKIRIDFKALNTNPEISLLGQCDLIPIGEFDNDTTKTHFYMHSCAYGFISNVRSYVDDGNKDAAWTALGSIPDLKSSVHATTTLKEDAVIACGQINQIHDAFWPMPMDIMTIDASKDWGVLHFGEVNAPVTLTKGDIESMLGILADSLFSSPAPVTERGRPSNNNRRGSKKQRGSKKPESGEKQ